MNDRAETNPQIDPNTPILPTAELAPAPSGTGEARGNTVEDFSADISMLLEGTRLNLPVAAKSKEKMVNAYADIIDAAHNPHMLNAALRGAVHENNKTLLPAYIETRLGEFSGRVDTEKSSLLGSQEAEIEQKAREIDEEKFKDQASEEKAERVAIIKNHLKLALDKNFDSVASTEAIQVAAHVINEYARSLTDSLEKEEFMKWVSGRYEYEFIEGAKDEDENSIGLNTLMDIWHNTLEGTRITKQLGVWGTKAIESIKAASKTEGDASASEKEKKPAGGEEKKEANLSSADKAHRAVGGYLIAKEESVVNDLQAIMTGWLEKAYQKPLGETQLSQKFDDIISSIIIRAKGLTFSEDSINLLLAQGIRRDLISGNYLKQSSSVPKDKAITATSPEQEPTNVIRAGAGKYAPVDIIIGSLPVVEQLDFVEELKGHIDKGNDDDTLQLVLDLVSKLEPGDPNRIVIARRLLKF